MNSMTSPRRRQLVTWASAASKSSSRVCRSGSHCAGGTWPAVMVIEILVDAGLSARTRAPELDHGRAIVGDLDDRHALGAAHRRYVEHEFTRKREGLLTGESGPSERCHYGAKEAGETLAQVSHWSCPGSALRRNGNLRRNERRPDGRGAFNPRRGRCRQVHFVVRRATGSGARRFSCAIILKLVRSRFHAPVGQRERRHKGRTPMLRPT